jgi:hypothetical protein
LLNPLTHRKVLRNGVRGRAAVVEVGSVDRDAPSFNLPMTLQVHVEGWTPYEVEDQWMVRARDAAGLSGWVPVRVDPDDLQNVAIDWDGVRLTRDREAAEAWDTPRRIDLQLVPESALDALADETLTRLERLGALRTSGVLTDAEFQAQKRRILSER